MVKVALVSVLVHYTTSSFIKTLILLRVQITGKTMVSGSPFIVFEIGLLRAIGYIDRPL